MSEGQPNPIPPVGSPADRPHAPPTDEEAVYFDGSPMFGGNPEKVLGFAAAGTLFLILPVIIKLVHHEWPPGWAFVVFGVIGITLWIATYITMKTIRYRISNYRIDFERGILSKDITTLELWHVEDIAFHQSIIDQIFGMGTIRVMSHDDSMPDLRMRGLPKARTIFEELKQRIIAVKRQTGVLKVDTGM